MKVIISSKDSEIAKQIKDAISESLGSQVKEILIEKSFEKMVSNVSKLKPSLVVVTYDTLFTNNGFSLPKLNVPFIVLGDSFRKAEDVLKAGALAFLTLPVDKEVIDLAMHKWFKKQPDPSSNLTFRVKGEEITVPISKLQYIEAEDKFCHLYLKEPNKKVSVLYSMKKIFNDLPSDFLKVHKTYIVRQSIISELFYTEGNRYKIRLKNGKEIPVGRKYFQLLKISLNESQ